MIQSIIIIFKYFILNIADAAAQLVARGRGAGRASAPRQPAVAVVGYDGGVSDGLHTKTQYVAEHVAPGKATAPA